MVHVATVLRYVVISKYYMYNTSVRYIATHYQQRDKSYKDNINFQSKRYHNQEFNKQGRLIIKSKLNTSIANVIMQEPCHLCFITETILR